MEKMLHEYIPSNVSTCSPDSNIGRVLAVGSDVLLDGSHMKTPDTCTTTAVKIITGSVTNYHLR
jgi:hypothetical protein